MTDDKGIKKELRKPSGRDLKDFVKSGKSPAGKGNSAPTIPTPADTDFGTSSVHAPYDVIDDLDDLTKHARRTYGHNHSRAALTRVWFYALTHAPEPLQEHLLSSEDQNEMLERLLKLLRNVELNAE